jgi:hypothetical protein
MMPKDKQPVFVPVGGERTPVDPAAAPIELPAWFRVY